MTAYHQTVSKYAPLATTLFSILHWPRTQCLHAVHAVCTTTILIVGTVVLNSLYSRDFLAVFQVQPATATQHLVPVF